MTRLHLALEKGDAATVARLVDSGVGLEEQDDNGRKGQRPLHIAVRHGRLVAVEKLIAAGVDVDATFAHRITPVFLAAQDGQTEALELLIAARANIDAPRSDGTTPVCVAARHGQVATFKLLIGAGADATRSRGDGKTPLQASRSRGNALCAAVCHIATLHDSEPLTQEELLAVAEPGALEAALPAAFARSPLGTLERVAALVGPIRAAASQVGQCDAEGGDRLAMAVIRVQQMAVGLLRTLATADLQNAVLSPRGAAVIEALVLAKCKTVTAHPGIQQAIGAQWRVVAAEDVPDAVAIMFHAWWHLISSAFFP
eukprot:1704170-Prymnesium_polylepis.1